MLRNIFMAAFRKPSSTYTAAADWITTVDTCGGVGTVDIAAAAAVDAAPDACVAETTWVACVERGTIALLVSSLLTEPGITNRR